jgi:hypothetical protein
MSKMFSLLVIVVYIHQTLALELAPCSHYHMLFLT